MALSSLSVLSDDELELVFKGICNPFDPRVAMAFGTVSRWMYAITQVARQQLRAQNEAAIALCLKAGIPSCKQLREATTARWINLVELTVAELAMLGAMGSVVPALKSLYLFDNDVASEGVRRLVEGLGSGALPAVTRLALGSMQMGDAGAAALAAALGRGALLRLKYLNLSGSGIGDAGLVALAPALRQRPALEELALWNNPLGDEGLAALVAPPPAGAPPPTGVLAKLDVGSTKITDVGCAALAAALDRGALPALEYLRLSPNPASAAATAAVYAARDGLQVW